MLKTVTDGKNQGLFSPFIDMNAKAKYYFQKNFRNDIIGIYDSNNTLVAKYVYDAWGNHKVYNATGVENNATTFIGNINPFRYRGYYFDIESKLYYCIARYYKPEMGIWLSLDELKYLNPNILTGLNLFIYCGNDPVNKFDPTGCDAIYVTMFLFMDGGIWVVGHARLYYQDENGEWWYTEYGGGSPDTAHIRNVKINKTTEQLRKDLRRKMFDVVFLEGDYSYIKSYAEEYQDKDYKQGYNLLKNNCLKYVVDALNSKGDTLPYLVVPRYFSLFLMMWKTMATVPGKLSEKFGGGFADAGFGYTYDRNDPLYNLLSRYRI